MIYDDSWCVKEGNKINNLNKKRKKIISKNKLQKSEKTSEEKVAILNINNFQQKKS